MHSQILQNTYYK